MKIQIEDSWYKVLQDEFEKEYFKELAGKVRSAYFAGQTFPPAPLLFNAFKLCPFNEVKVVILGQDPYHGDGQAHGLSFSVPDGIRTPPSLQNIYKEIKDDLGKDIPDSGNLERWAKQGVLLLNSSLTVEKHRAGSHQGWGWETFTDAVIKTISDSREHVVFLLWGRFAKDKSYLIDDSKHLVLTAAHPSPFSAYSGFFGCKHFSQTNDYLKKHGLPTVEW
ncbi:uracil-DNA glycosylase [bacterium]|nr:uracil-DNA glycosylase [bacterium]